jgi:phosphoribosyl-ATP pyrophosphohydrolase/phosphoribosyl-AMP cyclohydrolase
MVGYMNEEAYRKTEDEGLVTFYSRSRQTLWTKGETSGNYLRVVTIETDCDSAAILIKAKPAGPVCHTGMVRLGEQQPGVYVPLDEINNSSLKRAARDQIQQLFSKER